MYMATIVVFYSSLLGTMCLLILAGVERSVGRRVFFSRFRSSSDHAIISFVDTTLHAGVLVVDRIAAVVAKFVRSIFAGTIVRMRRMSARLRDRAEKRRVSLKGQGSVSSFLRTITEHKKSLHNDEDIFPPKE